MREALGDNVSTGPAVEAESDRQPNGTVHAYIMWGGGGRLDGKRLETSKGWSVYLKGRKKSRDIFFLSSPGVLWSINYRGDVSITKIRAKRERGDPQTALVNFS